VTEQRDWPPEQSAKGSLRPWHDTAVGYLAVQFEDAEEAQRAQRGLQQRGVPEGDLRLYDGEETLRIAARLQQERSVLAKAINEVVVDHRAEKRWLGNARAGGSLLFVYAPSKERATRMVGLLADYQYGSLDYFGQHGVEVTERDVGSTPTGKGMIGMTPTTTATSIQACKLRVRFQERLQPTADGLEVAWRRPFWR
jgi:hypothetical protein